MNDVDNQRYCKAWPFFKASISYVFDRKGTSGDTHCKLTKLAAACLGDKPLHVDTVVRYIGKLNPTFYEVFLSVLSSVDERLNVYEVDRLIEWIKLNADRVKLYAIIFFYRCISRPCNVTLFQSLRHVYWKLRTTESIIDAPNIHNEHRYVWKDLVPKPLRLSTSGLLKEILSQLSKIKNHQIHPLIKICMERYRPQWPLHLTLILPRRFLFVKTVVELRRSSNAKRLGHIMRLLTEDEKREIKTVILLHQRSQQLEICYDDRLPKKDLSVYTDSIRAVTSVCVCQFCSSVLTYVDLKNRPPVKGVYYDNETLRYRCGNCNSRSVYKFPLVDGDSTYRIIQADLPSVGVCSGRLDCFNLAAMPRGVCGTCGSRK